MFQYVSKPLRIFNMVAPRTRHDGLSLVGLMTALSVVFCLLGIVVPVTTSWIHSTQVDKSKGLLIQATAHAKALALRNQKHAKEGLAASAGLKLLPNALLLVCKSDPADHDCAEGGASVDWVTDLSRGAGVAVTINNESQGVLGFDDSGVLIAAADFKISKGAEHIEGQLH